MLTHWDCLDWPGKQFSAVTGIFHQIRLKSGMRPFYNSPYKLSQKEIEAMKEELDKMI